MNDRCVHGDGQVRQTTPDHDRLIFQIKPVPPFRLDSRFRALRRRALNAVDRWDRTTYRRILVIDQRPLAIKVVQIAPLERPMLKVTASGPSLPPSTRFVAMSALSRLPGVGRGLDDFYGAAADEARLGRRARLFRGLKPPRFSTVFEALINAFACQQVMLSLGIQLLNRLATTCADGRDVTGDRAYAFPTPDDLARLEPEELCTLGFSRQKGQAIITLARAVAAGEVDLDELESLDETAAVARQRMLRGVGGLTAEYVLLRGLRPARVPRRRRRRPQQPAALARAPGAARLRWCATGPRQAAAVPGPRLPAPPAVGPGA
jgi:DNA-3-methyladenine glycosylase II